MVIPTTRQPQPGHRYRLTWDRVRELWRQSMKNRASWSHFLLILSFFVTFALMRGITYSIRYHWLPFLHNVETSSGLHIHHMVYGIIVLIIVGYIAVNFNAQRWQAPLAIGYGIGAALTLDEFALWLNLEDVYWARQGRESLDAIVLAGTVFLLILLSNPFLRAVRYELRALRHLRRAAQQPSD
ncbi:MAG: hypothetical protein ACTHMJ_13755 [Thermomicrobiales bacterium]